MEIDTINQTITSDDVDIFKKVKNQDSRRDDSSISMMYV